MFISQKITVLGYNLKGSCCIIIEYVQEELESYGKLLARSQASASGDKVFFRVLILLIKSSNNKNAGHGGCLEPDRSLP